MSKKTKTAYQTIGFWERNRRSQGYLLKKTVRNIVYKIARAALLFGMCFMILQPILNKISISFMAEEDLYNPMIIAIPEHFTKANYELAAQFMSYGTSIINTIVVSLTIAVLQIAVCTLVGYGFARFDFPLKKFWFLCVMLVIVVPPQTISTSLYLHFRYFDLFGIIEAVTGSSLNLRDSVLPYYLMSAGCMGLKNGLYIFMIRQYFRNIPKELEEAAYVDGCGTLKTFVRIMLPDAKPIFHSDRGFQYTSQAFYSRLKKHHMKQSMSRVAHCIDNGPMEGFWGILKREMYYGKRFTSNEELIQSIQDYIEYYNNRRLQRKLHIMTPMAFHELTLKAA